MCCLLPLEAASRVRFLDPIIRLRLRKLAQARQRGRGGARARTQGDSTCLAGGGCCSGIGEHLLRVLCAARARPCEFDQPCRRPSRACAQGTRAPSGRRCAKASAARLRGRRGSALHPRRGTARQRQDDDRREDRRAHAGRAAQASACLVRLLASCRRRTNGDPRTECGIACASSTRKRVSPRACQACEGYSLTRSSATGSRHGGAHARSTKKL